MGWAPLILFCFWVCWADFWEKAFLGCAAADWILICTWNSGLRHIHHHSVGSLIIDIDQSCIHSYDLECPAFSTQHDHWRKPDLKVLTLENNSVSCWPEKSFFQILKAMREDCYVDKILSNESAFFSICLTKIALVPSWLSYQSEYLYP